RGGLDVVARHEALRRGGDAAPVEPPGSTAALAPVEIAESEILGDRHGADASVAERLLGEAMDAKTLRRLSRAVILGAGDDDGAAGLDALSRQHLDQLALAVAGDAGDADDLALVDGEGVDDEARPAARILGAEVPERQHRGGARSI